MRSEPLETIANILINALTDWRRPRAWWIRLRHMFLISRVRKLVREGKLTISDRPLLQELILLAYTSRLIGPMTVIMLSLALKSVSSDVAPLALEPGERPNITGLLH